MTGEVLIWASSLVHGGTKVEDWNRTRLSMTTHYFAEADQAGAANTKFWKPFNSGGGKLTPMRAPYATADTASAFAQRHFGGKASKAAAAVPAETAY